MDVWWRWDELIALMAEGNDGGTVGRVQRYLLFDW